MSDNNNFVQVPVLYLAGSGVSSTATSIILTSMKLPDGSTTIAMTDFGAIGYATLEPGTEREENISFTGITQNANGTATLTTVVRGLNFVAPYTTVAAYRQAHAGGTAAVISNSAPFYNEMLAKDNDETITGVYTFTSTAIAVYDAAPAFSTDQEIITKKYADDLAIAGAPDSNATTKGLLELATIAEASAQTAAGGGDTTAALAITTALTSNTSAAAQLIPVTDADGDIPVEFMELDATWAFTGPMTASSTVDILTATNWSLGSVAYTGSMATLNEADTFFTSTDISAAEAETLTSASTSDASALHYHEAQFGGFEVTVNLENTGGGASTSFYTAYSDSATPVITIAGANSSTTEITGRLQLATDVGIDVYPTTVAEYAGANPQGAVWIGSNFWTVVAIGPTPYKDGGAGSFVSGDDTGPLGHDPTNSYLLMLTTTTNIRRFSGIAGTALTLVDDITLDTAVDSDQGFIYDDTNQQYICIDTTANIIRLFDSAGTTVSTTAYTINDDLVKGLSLIEGRVYIMVMTGASSSGGVDTAHLTCKFIPTTLTI